MEQEPEGLKKGTDKLGMSNVVSFRQRSRAMLQSKGLFNSSTHPLQVEIINRLKIVSNNIDKPCNKQNEL